MTPLVAVIRASLVLSDGTREMELADWPTGIWLEEFNPPIPANEDTYVTSPDMEGSVRTRTKPVNPVGTGKGWIGMDTAEEFWDMWDDFQDLLLSAHRNKGDLTYTPAGGETITYELEAIRFTEMPQDNLQPMRVGSFAFEFTSKPYGLLPEVQLVNDEALTGPIDKVTLSDVPGHVDARGRMVLTADDGIDRKDIEWGIAEYFDGADPINILADDLIVSGYSAVFDTAWLEGDVSSEWLAYCGLGAQAHRGLYRIKVVAQSGSLDTQVRLAWAVGSGPLRSNADNLAVIQVSNEPVELDLGLVYVPTDDGWTGQIETRNVVGVSALVLSQVFIIPADRHGRARAPFSNATPTTYDAADEFEQTVTGGSDPLNGKTARIGGNWATSGASGDFDVVEAVPFIHSGQAVRTAGPDPNTTEGRCAALGSVVTNCGVACDVKFTGLTVTSGVILGVMARFSDVDNFLMAVLGVGGGSLGSFSVLKLVGGTPTTLAETPGSPYLSGQNIVYKLGLTVDPTGQWVAYINGNESLSGQDSDLVTGSGTLDDGKVGIYDGSLGSGTLPTRIFDNFTAWVPPQDQVIWADHNASFTHDTVEREGEDGPPHGDVPHYEGNRFWIPPATRNDLTSRLVVRQDRNDLVTSPIGDEHDELVLNVYATPRVLLVSQVF